MEDTTINPNNSITPLVLSDDQFIYSLNQLLEALNRMDEKEFKKYANQQKNEITQWINYALNEKGLSQKLETKNEKKHYTTTLSTHLNIQPASNTTITKTPEKSDTPKKSFSDMFKDYFSTKQEEKIVETDDLADDETEEEYEVKEPSYIKTGVDGFDELITNGIPQGSSVLLCGGPGTGKTTFALQILANSALNKEKCLYLSFEEEPAQLRAHMKNYGWDPVKMEKEGYLRIKKMNPFDISRSVEALLAHASGELMININELNGILPSDFKPQRIVLDSLSAVASAFTDKEEGYRIYIDQLFTIFKNVGATSFLISEVEENTNRYTRTGTEEFLADAVVVFYNFRQKSVRVQAIEIIKIRGVLHQKKIVPFKITPGKGIVVFPKEDAFAD